MTDRPTCGQCHHFVPARRPHDDSTCHAHAPRDSGGWAPVEHDDVACGSDFRAIRAQMPPNFSGPGQTIVCATPPKVWSHGEPQDHVGGFEV